MVEKRLKNVDQRTIQPCKAVVMTFGKRLVALWALHAILVKLPVLSGLQNRSNHSEPQLPTDSRVKLSTEITVAWLDNLQVRRNAEPSSQRKAVERLHPLFIA